MPVADWDPEVINGAVAVEEAASTAAATPCAPFPITTRGLASAEQPRLHTAAKDGPASTNIAQAMLANAEVHPDMPAVVLAGPRNSITRKRIYSTWTYAQLAEHATAVAHGLLTVGFTPGERAVLMVPPSLDFYSLTYGLLLAGVVPVLIDPGLGRMQLAHCLAEAAPTAFVGIPLAHVASYILDWARSSVKRRITVGGRGFGHTLEHIIALGRKSSSVAFPNLSEDDVAAVAFTSGSTGIAKGVLYKQKNFAAQVSMIRAAINSRPGQVDMATFPPFALFPPALGTTALLPHMDFRRPAAVKPSMLLELIQDWKVNNIFGSPGLLAPVVRHAAKHNARWPDSVRYVISGGAPVPVAVLEGMHALLPAHAEVLTPYGATECLPISTIGSRELLNDTRAATEAGAGVCVGRPVKPNDVRIIAITDDQIKEWKNASELEVGQIGEITVAGPTTTEAYLNREGATAAAKIFAPDGSIIHRMGDVGYFDQQGRLWYCGRKSHRVELAGGRTMHTAQVEEILNAHPAVFRTALVGVKSSKGQTTPVVCVELDCKQLVSCSAKTTATGLFSELRAMCDAHSTSHGIQHFLLHPGFPVDIRHNAKITRELLGPWAAQRLKL